LPQRRVLRLERMVDTLAGTIVDLKAENAALRQPLRERDVLWCKALIATLDARQIEAVTRHFNEHRPDAATEETRALLAALRPRTAHQGGQAAAKEGDDEISR